MRELAILLWGEGILGGSPVQKHLPVSCLVLSNLFILYPSFVDSISQALFPLPSIFVWPVGGDNEFRRWEEEGS